MISNLCKLGNLGPALLAVLIAGALPAAGRAEALTFRNDTNGPVIVQAAISVRGMMKPGRPYLLNAGDSTPPIVGPGDKLITVFDGKNPNVIICQEKVMASPGDKAFNVAPDGAGGVKLERRIVP
jgi:hypothetical protein